MNKLRVFGITGIFIVGFVAIFAQSERPVDKPLATYYRDIHHFGLTEFMNMDLEMMGHFPTQKDWDKILENIKLVPVDSLRYIDSLDIGQVADSLFVKIYTQNYAYQSRNIYTIVPNAERTTDTLMVVDMQVDLEMKSAVDDWETFRRKNYTVDYTFKQNPDKFNKRIVINKNYQE